jgi:hypothetical protein
VSLSLQRETVKNRFIEADGTQDGATMRWSGVERRWELGKGSRVAAEAVCRSVELGFSRIKFVSKSNRLGCSIVI